MFYSFVGLERPGYVVESGEPDQEIADVSTFIRHSWGNQAASVSAAAPLS
jgi:hypothetical protein